MQMSGTDICFTTGRGGGKVASAAEAESKLGGVIGWQQYAAWLHRTFEQSGQKHIDMSQSGSTIFALQEGQGGMLQEEGHRGTGAG